MPELVLDAELIPLELAHLMERQHIYAFHIAERPGEPGEFCDVVRVVRQPRYQHVPQPYRFPAGREGLRKIERGANVHARELAMLFGMPALDVQQYEVNGF